jgi:CheY-like chemotaxis protein
LATFVGAVMASKVVLVADDEEGVREFVATVLAEAGLGVITVADGAAALGVIRGRPVDVLVSDVQMPGMNGFELARRARLVHPLLPIVMISAYSFTASDPGEYDAFLRKPFKVQELTRTVLRFAAPAERG